MKNLRRSIRLSFGQASVAAGGFAVSVLSARQLGLEQRGELALALQIAYVAGPLLAFGMSTYLLRDPDDTPHLATILRFPVLLGSALAAVAYVVGLSPFIVGGVLCAVGGVSILVLRSMLVSHGRAGAATLTLLIVGSTYLVGALLLYHQGVEQAFLWLGPYLVFSAIAAVIAATGVFRHESLRGLLRASAGQVPGAFGRIVALRLDRLLIALMVGPEQLAIYVMAAVVLEASLWIVTSYADLTVASNTAHFSPTRALKSTAWSTLPVICLVAASAGVTLVIVLPFIGDEYQSMTPLLMPLSLATVALGVGSIASRWLLAGPRPGLMSRPQVLQALVAVPVYIVFIAQWGTYGAAWGSLVVYASGTVAAVLLLRRYH